MREAEPQMRGPEHGPGVMPELAPSCRQAIQTREVGRTRNKGKSHSKFVLITDHLPSLGLGLTLSRMQTEQILTISYTIY